jgi:hypothetical protein
MSDGTHHFEKYIKNSAKNIMTLKPESLLAYT